MAMASTLWDSAFLGLPQMPGAADKVTLCTHPHPIPANSLEMNPQVHTRKVGKAGENPVYSPLTELCGPRPDP